VNNTYLKIPGFCSRWFKA